ncbi:unnamed protein product [Phyllotreta striolata]|uniref:Lysosomal Pro-X carboxypeptidase n=1 Tax=Phyllotreta striolata TaxID=444603 RepID=A0A9N9TTN1_PHYSR|nr:unnamed protein product [Phyllotreta striolata]
MRLLLLNLLGCLVVPRVIAMDETHTLKTKYLDVPLDHFSSLPNVTFKLRYLINADHYVRNGPIFVFTGGQCNIETSAENTGFLFDVAPHFNALVVFIEHRYYGKSLPFVNISYTNYEQMKYLTVAQVLQDYALVIEALRKTYISHANYTKTENIIAFGSYYGGMLASWLRMKYPFAVKGSIASSVPLFHFQGFPGCDTFYEKVTSVVQQLGLGRCIKTIKLGWMVLSSAFTTPSGLDYVSTNWRLCKHLRTNADADALLDWLRDVYVQLVLFNYPFTSNYYRPLPPYALKTFCDKITTVVFTDSKSLIEAFGNALELYTNYTKATACVDIGEKRDEIMWKYQTCTELVMPSCTTSRDMFANERGYEKYRQDCRARFGVAPKRDWIKSTFGGHDFDYYSNMLFASGALDPVAAERIYFDNSTTSSSLISYQIEQAPHLMDFMSADPADNVHVKHARKFYAQVLKKWLQL